MLFGESPLGNEHSSVNLVCWPNVFVKNGLASTREKASEQIIKRIFASVFCACLIFLTVFNQY